MDFIRSQLSQFQLQEKCLNLEKRTPIRTLSATAASSSPSAGTSPSATHFSVPSFFSVLFVFWTFLSKAFLLSPYSLPRSLFG